MNIVSKTRKSPVTQACYKDYKKIDSAFESLKLLLGQTGILEGNWFRISDIAENGYSRALEDMATKLGRGRDTVHGTSDKAKLKEGQRHTNAISRRISSAFGRDSVVIGNTYRLEKSTIPRKAANLQYRFTSNEMPLLGRDVNLKPLVYHDIPSDGTPVTVFQRKLGGYTPEKMEGKDKKAWLRGEIMAAVDIYVDELMEENRKLQEQLETIKKVFGD